MRRQSVITVEGAREHNLRGVDVVVPRDTLTVFTGVSGSGKSSLAFDTICQEGQRRFLESLSAYARQFLGGMEKPRVDRVDGLSPTVSIDQKTVARNPRSTVGTVTEIYDHLRLLFARLGTLHCPTTGEPVVAETRDGIVDKILDRGEGRRVVMLAPLVVDRKGAYRKELADLRAEGFVRARIDGAIVRLDEVDRLDRYKRHTIELVLDRIKPSRDKRARLAEAVEAAADRAVGGEVVALIDDDVHRFNTQRSFAGCEPVPAMEPRLFSFNAPQGACERCSGLGHVHGVDESRLVPDPTKSLEDGALAILTPKRFLTYCGMSIEGLRTICEANRVPMDRPWSAMTRRQQRIVLYGTGDREYDLAYKWEGETFAFEKEERKTFPGVIPLVEANYAETASRNIARRYLAEVVCPSCDGARLNAIARAARFHERTIVELAAMPIRDLLAFVDALEPTDREALIGRDLFKELASRLAFLGEVGLDYLTLDRAANTLSGGESQRIHLATQLGAGLQGVLYVLDEPSIGLHPRDNGRLLAALAGLRDLGNTVFVVEHDIETLHAADHLVDLGPGAGREGGEVVAEGRAKDLIACARSVTGAFLRGDRAIPTPTTRRPFDPGRVIGVRGAAEHNLRTLDVDFPLGCLTVVTGVSGSGKSTLVNRILKRALARTLHGASAVPGKHAGIDGLDAVDKVIEIDQRPLGRSPRSNPATYTKVYDEIRKLFAAVPEARTRGYGPSRFSFNVKGGRCETCKGAGVTVVEMQFLPNVEVVCEACGGRRFNRESLEITWNDKAIDDVLAMTVAEARDFFADVPKVKRTLDALDAVGLGYLPLGQSTTTISGGEAQRIKLASELRRPATGRTVYLLDEPTTGLHLAEVERLVVALERLVDAGNTVIVIEHHTDVIKVADHVIDLGPDGGDGGGTIVVAGTPEAVAATPASHTGRALAATLAGTVEPIAPAAPARQPTDGALRVFGARQHNLRDVDVEIPHASLTVVTGVSGSGKTSLAFDTIFAEGQRRFVESLSTYARRFLGRLEKAPVDRIEGLGPAIAVDQRTASRNPRSTVATTTEIHDYLRLLFARAGRLHCPTCDASLRAWTPSAAARDTASRRDGERVHVVAPLAFAANAKQRDGLRKDLQRAGFVRAVVADTVVDLRRDALPSWAEGDAAWVVVDRVAVRADARTRLAEAFETAFTIGRGRAALWAPDAPLAHYAQTPSCVTHGFSFDESLTPRHFSFNSHVGACPACDGLGTTVQTDEARVVADETKPLLEGALVDVVDKAFRREGGVWRSAIRAAVASTGADPDVPLADLPERARSVAFQGTGGERVEVRHRWKGKKQSTLTWKTAWRGIVPALERWARRNEEGAGRSLGYESVLERAACRDCGGERLNPVARAVRVGRGKGERLAAILGRTVDDALAWSEGAIARKADAPIVEPIRREIAHRLRFLRDVGLGYLTLDRRSATLSGGEAQRIRLATQIGNRLTGVTYVLDEPTIGLHPRDTERLIGTLVDLRDLGNTVVVVEHDEDVIRAADHVVELGPGAGRHGGTIVATGTPTAIRRDRGSPTGALLRRRRRAEPRDRGEPDGALTVVGASRNNLRGVDVDFPRGRLTVVTGPSGSGKSSLVMGELADTWKSCPGAEDLARVIVVDAAPIGQTPASNPATYVGAFTPIRELFATLPEAAVRGYTAARFSFNVKGGRCDACEGRGFERVEMHFLSDVWVTCEACGGKRYDEATLSVRFKGRSIADVLDTEVAEAIDLFRDVPKVFRPLDLLDRVGLGYVKLGQPATTLSGGEAQRVKLAAELARRDAGRTLYLLDEPTVGLHGTEVSQLIDVLHDLVDRGGTVVVVEHQLDVIAAADWVVDLGPDGGADGGRIVVAGTPAAVAACSASATGRFLR